MRVVHSALLLVAAVATFGFGAAGVARAAGNDAQPAAIGTTSPAVPLRRQVETAPAEAPRATAARKVKLVNAGFEEPLKGDGDPTGWVTGQHAGVPSYTFALDEKVRREGKQSLRIDNIGPEPYGAIYQPLPIAGLAGTTLRLTAWVRTQNAGGERKGWGAALQLQAKKGGSPLAYNDLSAHLISGSSEWTRREVVVAIPKDAEHVEVGIMLRGKGSVWLDDVELEVVPAT